MQFIPWATNFVGTLVSAATPSPHLDSSAIESLALKQFSLPSITNTKPFIQDDRPQAIRTGADLAIQDLSQVPQHELPTVEEISGMQDIHSLTPLLNTCSFKVREAATARIGELPLSQENVSFMRAAWELRQPEIAHRLRSALPYMVFNELPAELRDPDLIKMVSLDREKLDYILHKACKAQLTANFDESLEILRKPLTRLEEKGKLLALLREHFTTLRLLDIHEGSFANNFCADYLNAIRSEDQEKLSKLREQFNFNCEIAEFYVSHGGEVRPATIIQQMYHVARLQDALSSNRRFTDECRPWIPIVRAAFAEKLERHAQAIEDHDMATLYELTPELSYLYKEVVARLHFTPFPDYDEPVWNLVMSNLITAMAEGDTTKCDALLEAVSSISTLTERSGSERIVSADSVEALYSLYGPALEVPGDKLDKHLSRVAEVIENASNNLRKRLFRLDSTWLESAANRYHTALDMRKYEEGLTTLLQIDAYLLAVEKLSDLSISLESPAATRFIASTISYSVESGAALFSPEQEKAISRVRRFSIDAIGVRTVESPELEAILESD